MALAKKVGIVAAVSASLVAGGVTVDKVVGHDPADGRGAQNGAASASGVLPLAVTPIKREGAARGTARKRSSRHASHRAKQADTAGVVGKRAGSAADSADSGTADSVGGSAPDDGSFNSPASTSPADPAPGGSSTQNPDLAP